MVQVLQVWNIDAIAMKEEAVHGGPGCLQRPYGYLLLEAVCHQGPPRWLPK